MYAGLDLGGSPFAELEERLFLGLLLLLFLLLADEVLFGLLVGVLRDRHEGVERVIDHLVLIGVEDELTQLAVLLQLEVRAAVYNDLADFVY